MGDSDGIVIPYDNNCALSPCGRLMDSANESPQREVALIDEGGVEAVLGVIERRQSRGQLRRAFGIVPIRGIIVAYSEVGAAADFEVIGGQARMSNGKIVRGQINLVDVLVDERCIRVLLGCTASSGHIGRPPVGILIVCAEPDQTTRMLLGPHYRKSLEHYSRVNAGYSHSVYFGLVLFMRLLDASYSQ